MVFWSNTVQTSSMIEESKFPDPKYFSYEGKVTSKTLRYGYRTVNSPSDASEQPDFFDN